MAFFDQLSNKVTNMGNQLSSKAKDLTEQKKLEQEVRSLTAEKQTQFTEMGKLLFEFLTAEEGAAQPDYSAYVRKVQELDEKIARNNARITDIKAQITCQSCGKSIPEGTEICPYCGKPSSGIPKEEPKPARVIPAQPQMQAQPRMQAQPAGGVVFCTSCGAPAAAGSKFCMKCGTPLMQPASQNPEPVNNEAAEAVIDSVADTAEAAFETVNNDILPDDAEA